MVKDSEGTASDSPSSRTPPDLEGDGHRRGPKVIVYKMRPKKRRGARMAMSGAHPGDG